LIPKTNAFYLFNFKQIQDPNAELKIQMDKLKENEKHIETLKMELTKWQEEAHELNVKCGTYEAQLEQCQAEYRGQIISKDVISNLLIKVIIAPIVVSNTRICSKSFIEKSSF
jgi:hypothetical protein